MTIAPSIGSYLDTQNITVFTIARPDGKIAMTFVVQDDRTPDQGGRGRPGSVCWTRRGTRCSG